MKLKDAYFLEGMLWPTSVQFSSVAQSCPTLCNPMNRSMPGLHVYHQLPFTQTHVHWVGDAIQPSLSFPSPPAHNPSQHRGLFQTVNSSHEVAKVLEFQLQHQSFQWTLRVDLLYFFFLIFYVIFFISWRLITLHYCSGFCHTLTWISHGYTCRLISFRMDWLDLLEVQGTVKCLLQHHSSKA